MEDSLFARLFSAYHEKNHENLVQPSTFGLEPTNPVCVFRAMTVKHGTSQSLLGSVAMTVYFTTILWAWARRWQITESEDTHESFYAWQNYRSFGVCFHEVTKKLGITQFVRLFQRLETQLHVLLIRSPGFNFARQLETGTVQTVVRNPQEPQLPGRV